MMGYNSSQLQQWHDISCCAMLFRRFAGASFIPQGYSCLLLCYVVSLNIRGLACVSILLDTTLHNLTQILFLTASPSGKQLFTTPAATASCCAMLFRRIAAASSYPEGI